MQRKQGQSHRFPGVLSAFVSVVLGLSGLIAFRIQSAGIFVFLETGPAAGAHWSLSRSFSWGRELGRIGGWMVLVLVLGLLYLGRKKKIALARSLLPLSVALLCLLPALAVFLGLPVFFLPPAALGKLLVAFGLFGVLWSVWAIRSESQGGGRALQTTKDAPPPARSAVDRRGTLRGGSGTREGIAIFLVLLGILLALASQMPRSAWLRQPALTGDEPEYMLTVVSLLDDGDIELRNNSTSNAAKEFGASGYQFRFPHPVHNLGLPLLIAPAYAAGRLLFPASPQFGVFGLLIVISALLGSELYLLTRRRGLLLSLMAATTPLLPSLLPMTVQIYPELPAAWMAVLCYRRLGNRHYGQFLSLGGIAALPWLHVKYAALVVGLLLAVGVLRGFKKTFPGWIVFLIGLVGLSAISAIHYDSLLPTASYGKTTTVLSLGLFRGVLGLLTDRGFGVFWRTPLLLLTIPGWYLLFHRSKPESLALALVVGSHFIVVASYPMWWGGWSPPGRFLVPILPFAVLAAIEAGRWKGSRGAFLLGLLWIGSIGISLALLTPAPTWLGGSRTLVYQDPMEPPALGVLLGGIWDWGQALPNLIHPAPGDWVLALCLLGGSALFGSYLLKNGARSLNEPQAVTLFILACTVGSTLSVETLAELTRPYRSTFHGYAANQERRTYLKALAQKDFWRHFPAPPPQPSLVTLIYEAEALQGNHLFFTDEPRSDASGGFHRIVAEFDPTIAPIPISFRYPLELESWPAGNYRAHFRLAALSASPTSSSAVTRPKTVLAVAVKASWSLCFQRAQVLSRKEVLRSDLKATYSDITLRFQLRCSTPKLEWIVEAYGLPFRFDYVSVEAEEVFPD